MYSIRNLSIALTLLALAIIGTSPLAFAAITGTQPNIAPFMPPNVNLGATQNDFWIMGFDEMSYCNVPLPADLETDQGTISAGDYVQCHFFHAEPLNPPIVLVGRAAFDADIIGVISESALLDDSDAICGDPNVIYPAPPVPSGQPFRGLEAFQAGDYYQVSGNLQGIEIGVDVPTYSDQVRVITSCP